MQSKGIKGSSADFTFNKANLSNLINFIPTGFIKNRPLI